jgi:hypothetical protein
VKVFVLYFNGLVVAFLVLMSATAIAVEKQESKVLKPDDSVHIY